MVTRLTAITAVVPGGVVIEQPLSESFPSWDSGDEPVVDGTLPDVVALPPKGTLEAGTALLPAARVRVEPATALLPPERKLFELGTAPLPPEGAFELATAPLPPDRVLLEPAAAPLPPDEIPFDPATAPLPPDRVPLLPATALLPPERVPFEPATPGVPPAATPWLVEPPVAGFPVFGRYPQILGPADNGHGAV